MTFYPRKLKPGGTDLDATAAELDVLDSMTASTAELNLLDGATATTGEINLNDDKVASFGFAAAAGAANVCEVTITPQDAAGSAIADTRPFVVWLSDDSGGAGLTATSASGTVQVKSGEGTDFGTHTAKKALVVQPKAAGTYVLEITDTAKTAFYVCAAPLDGRAASVSTQLQTADYGT